MEKQTRNKPISMISPVQSNDPWRQSRRCQKSIKAGRVCWKGRFWAWSERVKEWWMPRAVMMTKMVWQMNDRVNRDKNGGVNSYYILYNFIIFITSGELAHMEMGSWEMSSGPCRFIYIWSHALTSHSEIEVVSRWSSLPRFICFWAPQGSAIGRHTKSYWLINRSIDLVIDSLIHLPINSSNDLFVNYGAADRSILLALPSQSTHSINVGLVTPRRAS